MDGIAACRVVPAERKRALLNLVIQVGELLKTIPDETQPLDSGVVTAFRELRNALIHNAHYEAGRDSSFHEPLARLEYLCNPPWLVSPEPAIGLASPPGSPAPVAADDSGLLSPPTAMSLFSPTSSAGTPMSLADAWDYVLPSEDWEKDVLSVLKAVAESLRVSGAAAGSAGINCTVLNSLKTYLHARLHEDQLSGFAHLNLPITNFLHHLSRLETLCGRFEAGSVAQEQAIGFELAICGQILRQLEHDPFFQPILAQFVGMHEQLVALVDLRNKLMHDGAHAAVVAVKPAELVGALLDKKHLFTVISIVMSARHFASKTPALYRSVVVELEKITKGAAAALRSAASGKAKSRAKSAKEIAAEGFLTPAGQRLSTCAVEDGAIEITPERLRAVMANALLRSLESGESPSGVDKKIISGGHASTFLKDLARSPQRILVECQAGHFDAFEVEVQYAIDTLKLSRSELETASARLTDDASKEVIAEYFALIDGQLECLSKLKGWVLSLKANYNDRLAGQYASHKVPSPAKKVAARTLVDALGRPSVAEERRVPPGSLFAGLGNGPPRQRLIEPRILPIKTRSSRK